ncbi:MAG: hypothetical protein EHM12_01015 [Dehalococcoidia bacterium]|nr:MAG: hypothetical protein EHM12_01015 [Dehalococcoidia bacterium]
MKKTYSPLIAAILAAVLIIMISGCTGKVTTEKELKSATENIQVILQSKLSNLNNTIAEAAKNISKSGVQGEETLKILNGVCKKYSYLVDCTVSDPYGKIISAAPDSYRRFEGTDTATTETSKKFFAESAKIRKPMLSTIFRAVEDIDGVVLVWPVITEQEELLGYVSALFKPEDLLEGTVSSAAKIRAIKVNVNQVDGTTIYCSNGTETGKNLFTDERYKAYPDLLTMGERMKVQKSGSATYTFPSDKTGQPVKKTGVWATIGLHDTEWRILSMAELGN